MAIARLSVGIGKKGKASPHAQYIAREGKYAKPSNHQEKLENTGHGNMPKWAEAEPNFFWQSADAHERANGSTYREHVIALPRELTPDQRHDLILDWIEQEIGDKHAYQYAIHNPPALDGREQPHCHLMFSERTIDGIERDPDQYFKRYNAKKPERGGARKANTGLGYTERKADLVAQRERWETVCNKHLEQAGSKATISMKSNKDRGLKSTPFNVPMDVFNRDDVKEIYINNLEAKHDYMRAARQRNSINIRQEIDQLMQAAEKQRQEQERQAELERQEQQRQAQERQAELERQEQQRQEQERQAELERQEQQRQEQERQAELERQEQERKAARKLSTPVDVPTIRGVGGKRFEEAFEDVHRIHDLVADKLDTGKMTRQQGIKDFDYFYLCVQSACYELENSMARRPDHLDIAKYETTYEAVDKLMSSIEQRAESVKLASTDEHDKATRKLVDVREKIDTHSARIGITIQQQQPTLTNTYKPR